MPVKDVIAREVICFRATEDEARVIHSAAERAGMSLSEYLRKIVISAANGGKPAPTKEQEYDGNEN